MRSVESLIDPVVVAEHRLPDRYAEVRTRAMTYIMQRRSSLCTTGQVRLYLKRHEADSILANRVIADLAADGYIDDLRAARSVIKSRQGRRAESRGMMLRRMLRLGVSRSVAEQALSELQTDEAVRVYAYLMTRHTSDIHALRNGELDAVQQRRLRKRITAAAARRGFSPGVVLPILDRAVNCARAENSDG